MLWILIAITLLTCLFTQLVAQLRDREKIFVLFHCNCHDGLVAGYALWLKYPPWSYHITWIAIQASWTDDTHLLAMCAGHNIIFLDVTINDRVLMESIAKAAGHLTIIDHHKSVEKLLFDLNIAHENKLIVKYSSTQAASVITSRDTYRSARIRGPATRIPRMRMTPGSATTRSMIFRN